MKNLDNYRKWGVVFCSAVLAGSMLLSGCISKPVQGEQTQPTEASEATQDTQEDKTEPAEATTHNERPHPDRDQEIDSAELAGTWERVWTEVEGDRNASAPGVCTVEIKQDENGSFRFTYTDKEFPEENVQDRELPVIPGELYPGCGNDQWIGEVTQVSGDTVCYTLTLLEDGTLLMLSSFEFDGQPMVSCQGFAPST